MLLLFDFREVSKKRKSGGHNENGVKMGQIILVQEMAVNLVLRLIYNLFDRTV